MPRPREVRQGCIAGIILSIFFGILSGVQADPGARVVAVMLTTVFCGVMVTMVYVILRTMAARQRR